MAASGDDDGRAPGTFDPAPDQPPGLRIERNGAVAVVILDRPRSLNALSIGMRAQLLEAYPKLSRDPQVYGVLIRSTVPRIFSVGGDVREMTGLVRHDLAAARRGLADELALCWLHECFTKPTVSLINGRVMGTGVGISLYGTHRVAGESYRFAMPEVAIGYFPDCGVMHAFARMPKAIGLYLGLTGTEIGRADAFHLGLVTHCIDAGRFGEIEAHFADADPIDPVLDRRHTDPGPSELLSQADRIERVFGAPSLSEILGRLEARAGEGRKEDAAWAAATLARLRQASPLALAVTDRGIRAAKDLDLRSVLLQDGRLAHRFVEIADFREGVRAVLVDKDGRPAWAPARLEDVTPAMLEALFAPAGTAELALLPRSAPQAARI